MKITHDFCPGDRHTSGFGLCSDEKGWAQVDTAQDASYFGTWANPTGLTICSQCEDDTTLKGLRGGCRVLCIASGGALHRAVERFWSIGRGRVPFGSRPSAVSSSEKKKDQDQPRARLRPPPLLVELRVP